MNNQQHTKYFHWSGAISWLHVATTLLFCIRIKSTDKIFTALLRKSLTRDIFLINNIDWITTIIQTFYYTNFLLINNLFIKIFF